MQGCDASILLKQPISEQIAAPNNASLRQSSIQIIDDIKAKLEAACPGIVSCADIISLSTTAALQLVCHSLLLMVCKEVTLAISSAKLVGSMAMPCLYEMLPVASCCQYV